MCLYNRTNPKSILKSILLTAVIFSLLIGIIAAPKAALAENELTRESSREEGTVLEGATPDRSTEDYRRWAQADPRWGSLRLGSNGRTVAEAGCLVTAITKLIIQSGYRDQDNFNVATLVNWLNANNGLSSEGNLYWQKPAQMIDGFEFDGMDYNGGYSTSSYIQNKIMNLVRANKHIVLTVHNYGHYIAVDNAKSLEMGCVYIMDSLNNTAGNADLPLTNRYSYISRICVYSGNNGDDSDYIARCDFSMTHLYAVVTSDYASFYTLPCTVAANEGSEAQGRAYRDTILEVTADIVNTRYEHWYQVRTEEDEHLSIWGGQIAFISFINDVEVEASAPPSGTLPTGRWYALTENIISRHRITAVIGRITDQDRNIICEAIVLPDCHGGFDISGTGIDAGISFGSLPEGHYTYELITDVEASSNITSSTTTYRSIFTSPFSTGIEALPTYTVTYIDPLTDEVLAVETIAEGFFAVEPPAPVHLDREFLCWSETGRIYEDTVITAVYQDPFIPGDVDSDGYVTMIDALSILRYVMNGVAENFSESAADVNNDGLIDATDALLAMRLAIRGRL